MRTTRSSWKYSSGSAEGRINITRLKVSAKLQACFYNPTAAVCYAMERIYCRSEGMLGQALLRLEYFPPTNIK